MGKRGVVGPSRLSLHEFAEQINLGVFPKQTLVLLCHMDPRQKLPPSGVITAGTPSLHPPPHHGLHLFLLRPPSGDFFFLCLPVQYLAILWEEVSRSPDGLGCKWAPWAGTPQPWASLECSERKPCVLLTPSSP